MSDKANRLRNLAPYLEPEWEPYFREAADELDRLAARNVALQALLLDSIGEGWCWNCLLARGYHTPDCRVGLLLGRPPDE